MKRITLLLCSMLLFTMTTYAQVSPASSKADALVTRLTEIGNNSGDISDYFTNEERQILREHFAAQQPQRQTANPLNQFFQNSTSENLNSSARASAFKNKDQAVKRAAPFNKGDHNLKTASGNPLAERQSYLHVGKQLPIRSPEDVVVLSHNTGNTITGANSVACQGGDNRFGRVFTLADYGITTEFTINTGEIGVQEIDANTNLTVNIYGVTAGFPTGFPGNGTLLGSTNVTILSTAGLTIVSYNFTTPVIVPVGTVAILVDVNQTADGVAFFPGGTAADDGSPSYLASVVCGVPNYTAAADLGFPDAHYYITVTGDTAGGGGGCAIVGDCNLSDSIPDPADGINVWTRPFADGTCCSGSGTGVTYDVYGPFTVDTDGNYTFTTTTDGWDGFLFLYQNCFDPLDQETNYVAGNDDFMGLTMSQLLDIPLTTGTDYYIVQTAFSPANFGNYDLVITGDGMTTCGGGGGSGNEWTVTVEDTVNFGDEVSWELRDNMGAVILSGGPYAAPPYSDTQMVTTENEPLEFFIESEGTFGDNTPMYTVSCSGNVVITGQLTGGTQGTFSGLVCDGGTGGGCGEANASNGFEDGLAYTNGSGFMAANDVTVAADTDFELQQITYNSFHAVGETITSVDVTYYSDAAGLPGAVIGNEAGVIPSSQSVIGSNFGLDVSEVVLDLTPMMFTGQMGATTTYWIGFEGISSAGGPLYWEMTSASAVGNPIALSTGGVYAYFDPAFDGVYSFDGECTPTGGTGGGDPVAYCIKNSAIPPQFSTFDPADPSIVTPIGPSAVTSNFENAGSIDPNDLSTGYAIDNAGDYFRIDVATGAYTPIGNIPGDWLGAEFDTSTGILYAMTGTDLYTLDTASATATLVGSLGAASGQLPIGLAIDGSSNGYLYDIINDLFYSVDLGTGAATVIGPIGFDANFGQGMGYDPTTDTVYMTAFNNSIFDSEFRSVNLATGMTTLIAQMEPSELSQYAWVSFGETQAPAACPRPDNLTVTNITETTADLNWDAEPNATNGYIWYVFEAGANPDTDTPVDTGTTAAGVTTATATGLTNATAYDAYVRSDCDADGVSVLRGPVPFQTQITPPSCGGNFYDTGGPAGPYQNDENYTVTIVPDTSGDAVTVDFTFFDVEANWDALYIYDGPDASFPQFDSGNPATNTGFPPGGYWGQSPIGSFTSTDPSGALTFVFMSDGSVNLEGWEADVTCGLVGFADNTIEGFTFYPNPTDGNINLRSVNTIDTVIIYNILGQEVVSQRVNAVTSQIDISALNTGTYVMKVSVNGETGTYKVLKR